MVFLCCGLLMSITWARFVSVTSWCNLVSLTLPPTHTLLFSKLWLMTQTVGCLTEEGSISSSVPLALSHSFVCPGLPSQPLTLGVGTAADSHWRDAGGLDEWSISSSALGRYWTQGPSAPHSSPAIETGKSAEKSIGGREKRQVMSFLSVLPDLPNTNSRSSLLLLTNPSRFCVPWGHLTTLHWCVNPVILIEWGWCGSRCLCA